MPRNGFSLVLVIAMAASTFALAIVAVLASDLIAEFGITRQQLGSLVTFSSLSGAFLAPFVGPWADRIGARNATLASLAVSAVALAWIGLAPTFAMVLVGALLTGFSKGITNPATNKLISQYVAPGKRGVVTGVKQSGVQFGTALAGLALPAIALAFGWRAGVVGSSVVPVVGVGVALWAIPRDVRSVDRDGGEGATASVSVVRLAAYGFLLGFGGTAMFTYVPLFSEESLGLSPVQAGATVSVMGIVGVIGRIGWGRIAERSIGSDRALIALAGLSVVAGAMLVAAPTVGPWIIWPTSVLIGLSASSWNSVGMLAVIERVPAAVAGKASGTVMLGFLSGLGLGAPLFGRSVDRIGDYRPGWIAVTLVFVVATVLWIRPTSRSTRPVGAAV
jgi:predicted MFS family arabinose efflux permease